MSQPKQVGRGREGGWSESRAGAAEVIYSNRDLVVLFVFTRSYAALRAADLDWIVGPGYSLGRVHSGEKP